MATIEQIKSQVQKLDSGSRLLGRSEIKELPKILWENETVENLAQGIYTKGNGLLVATNKRLIFIYKGLLYGVSVEDFPYDKITNIQYTTGLFYGEITIFSAGARAQIKQVKKGKTREFAEYVRARVSRPSHHAGVNNGAGSSGAGVTDQLERLAALKEKGILTEQEFQDQKRKILQ